MLLLCAAPRSMYLLRTVPPSATDIFATAHDAAIGQCLATLLSGGDEPAHLSAVATRRAQLPLRMGGLGLSSARAHRHAAYWASWADTVTALRESHPGTLAELLRPLQNPDGPGVPPSVREAELAAQSLLAQGFQVPTWAALAQGASPAGPAEDDDPPMQTRQGWQHGAGAAVDKRAFEIFFF